MGKILSIILISILLMSCNKAVLTDMTASNNELLGKWRLDKAVTEGDTDVPDEEEDPDDSEVFITFFPDGKVTTTFVFVDEDGETITSEGTYILSEDKKFLTIEDEEGTHHLEIIELTPTSLVYKDVISVEIEGEEPEEYWTILYYTKVE